MREIRVSKTSEPQKVASSILYALEEGEDVVVSALGLAAAVLVKACALVNNLKKKEMNLIYTPSMEYVKDIRGVVRSSVQMSIIRM